MKEHHSIYAQHAICYRPSVCLSVRPSHGCISQQESLANAEVSARQQCVYGGPLAKKCTANQRKEHDFNQVSSLTPYDLTFPPKWGSICPQYTRMAISLQRVIRSTHVWFQGGVFGDGGSNGAIYGSNKSKMAAAAILDNFKWPYLRNGSRSTYIARIFAIAQLSCYGSIRMSEATSGSKI